MNAAPALALALALALVGCTHPSAAVFVAGTSGSAGTIANTPTNFPSFSASPLTVLNDGTGSTTFNMTYQDDNSEADMMGLVLFVNSTSWYTLHTVTSAERLAATEPASFGPDGWKVWTGIVNDGILYAKYKYAVTSGAAPGSLLFGEAVVDSQFRLNYPPPSTMITLAVRAPSVITVASAPVNWTGVAQTGASWGAWSASPGDSNVASTNYLKLTNTGGYPTPTVVVDFTESVFTGADGTTVPLDGNVQFAWWEDKTPATSAPSKGNYSWLPTAASGSTTITFTATNDIVYVAYRIVSVPTPLVAQAYSATFTVTDVTS